MKPGSKCILLWICTALSVAVVIMLKPIGQDPAYHLFADQRAFFGIPNFWNVFTNLPFIAVGTYGTFLISRAKSDFEIKWIYGVLFVGILLTGIGSAYYRYAPDTNSLVFDRIPMTLVFMSLLTATVTELISIRFARFIFIPLLVLGLGSVLWWRHTELIRQGDLRLYGLVQYYHVLMKPVIILLYSSSENRLVFIPLIWVILWYGIAKVCEHFDVWIYEHSRIISGHSLKHLAAAVATWYIAKMFSSKYITRSKSNSVKSALN